MTDEDLKAVVEEAKALAIRTKAHEVKVWWEADDGRRFTIYVANNHRLRVMVKEHRE